MSLDSKTENKDQKCSRALLWASKDKDLRTTPEYSTKPYGYMHYVYMSLPCLILTQQREVAASYKFGTENIHHYHVHVCMKKCIEVQTRCTAFQIMCNLQCCLEAKSLSQQPCNVK